MKKKKNDREYRENGAFLKIYTYRIHSICL